jgi:hypothetical protein
MRSTVTRCARPRLRQPGALTREEAVERAESRWADGRKGAGARRACAWGSIFWKAKTSPGKITTASDHVAPVHRSLPPSMRSTATVNLPHLASVWRGVVCPNYLVTFVASSLTIGFDAFIMDLMSQSRDFAPMGDDEAAKGAGGNGEVEFSLHRSIKPCLRRDRSGRAGFCCTSPSPSMTPPLHILLAFPSSDVDCEPSPALDLNPLAVDHLAGVDGAAAALGAYRDREASSDAARGDDRARSRKRSSWKRCGFDAIGGGIRRTRKGSTSALRRLSSGFTVVE